MRTATADLKMEHAGKTHPLGRGLLSAAALLIAFATFVAGPSLAQSLRVSAASMDLQNRQAVEHGFTFASTPDDVQELIADGDLVRVWSTDSLELKESVAFPYARPQVRDFLELLAARYRDDCGESLVVTSLTRPRTRQPRHASKRSVHPAGMAIDLRRSWNRRCRSWLELTLLTLEANNILDAMVEWKPPHYHVALFPSQYSAAGADLLEKGEATHYEVAHGDTLWKIAKRHNTDVFSVQQINGLRSSKIYIGQVLRLPTSGR